MPSSDPSLSPKQIWSIVRSKVAKIALWVGAVSGGKTIASLFAWLIAVREARGAGLIVIVGKTLQTIERNIIEPLQDPNLFGELAAQTVHTRGSTTATILGREVHLVGANDARSEEKIRGATIELAYVDEATLLPVGFWEMLLTRLRTPHSRLLATTNPGSFNHWLRVQYILDAAAKNMVVFQFTMDDNPSLTDEYVRDMKAAFTGIFFDRFILGKWTNAEGAIFDMWDPKKHQIRWDELPTMWRLIAVGIDYGTTNPTAAILLGIALHTDHFGRHHPKLYAIDEWRYESKTERQKLTDAELSRGIREWLAQPHLPPNQPRLQPDWIILDPSAASFRVQLQQDGLISTQADNDVLDGIRTVASLLQSGHLLVTDRCTGWIKEVTEYVWDAKAAEVGEDKPVKKNDHSQDALRYAIKTTENIWRQHVKLAA
ncbi:PBSX family phage terminase large subunit [Humibacter ginsenosidimutans]|uniref:PBSX family phage terminase large subunit n=1 Tax=Humibacter ginsenosidimutans TaxID=2599293 RepID=A0A5B8M8M7_9MICO|nr:PBSX family phage terminase large subunit [Humibacter ginsenosidimutans]QDZ15790.1 PBSX family phage terminase large subunit [Humibacter ginsenosidimutans]